MDALTPAKTLHRSGNAVAMFWARLSDSEQPPLAYLGRALLADIPLSLAIVTLVNWLTSSALPTFEGYALTRVVLVMCVVTPILETVLMALVFWVLRYVVKNIHWRAVVSALLWAAFHSLAKPIWGLQIAWAFYIFSLSYLAWEKRSLWHALGMTAILHSLHNGVPAILLVLSRAAETPVP